MIKLINTFVKKSVCLLITMACANAISCDRVKLEFGAYTRHLIHGDYGLNEYNQFLGIQCDWLQISRFENSFHSTTYSIGAGMQNQWFGVGAGMIHGYNEALIHFPDWAQSGEILFYVAPEINVGVKNVSRVMGWNTAWLNQEGLDDVMLVGRMFGQAVSVSVAIVW
jgi:hypothetical protein